MEAIIGTIITSLTSLIIHFSPIKTRSKRRASRTKISSSQDQKYQDTENNNVVANFLYEITNTPFEEWMESLIIIATFGATAGIFYLAFISSNSIIIHMLIPSTPPELAILISPVIATVAGSVCAYPLWLRINHRVIRTICALAGFSLVAGFLYNLTYNVFLDADQESATKMIAFSISAIAFYFMWSWLRPDKV